MQSIVLDLQSGDKPPRDERDVLVWFDDFGSLSFTRGYYCRSDKEWWTPECVPARVRYWADLPKEISDVA